MPVMSSILIGLFSLPLSSITVVINQMKYVKKKNWDQKEQEVRQYGNLIGIALKGHEVRN